VRRHLFSGSAELDVGAWSALVGFAVLLFNVYAAAALMAGVMIYALSRAVNRLSKATAAVRAGDFSVRIPVRRRDQVGELQRSFNQMAENLEQLVATATQKELLEKELAIARDLQKSLIPSVLPSGDGVEFATLFEPSAAIGGDYFDILRLDEDRLAVIIADVSGHGLPTGLRMAMIKSALIILAGQAMDPDDILRRLDTVVRLDQPGRFFVTATFAVVDLRRGELELTNAGHPPTYIVRGGGVREVMLPGSPLGGLGQDYGRERLALEPGDVVVWLSDGFIEACDADSEPFGYDGIERVLAAVAAAAPPPLNGQPPGPSATTVRDALVAAVQRHTAGARPDDDRTLVVMRYKRAAAAEAAAV
jgi:sigma-B regulation protein RsbU (phosphoserine phosphatase)